MSKAQAARTLSAYRLSEERLTEKASRRQVSGSEEEPRIRPEAGRQSHQALGGGFRRAPLCHPPRSLRLHGGHEAGLSVSRSTMCRAIARIGPTGKKGDE
jgi:hypothetical protein